ncbi:hypothetical protein V6N11_066657 [Hibiscus sabdariffa]|uniref:Uncharacterized protein n=2 Tax=Hibiscus sabdariffa TaxID=183260 RepID=A0ABR2BTS0_9ROSI
MSTDSLMIKFDELRFTVEEQDVVYAFSDSVNVPIEDPSYSPVGTGPVTLPSGFGNAVPLRAAPVTAPRSPAHAAPLPGHAKATHATTEEIAANAGINGADVAGLHGLSKVFAVDVSGHVHVSENALLGDEAGVFAASVSHGVAAPVTFAPSFDAIEE